MRSLFWASAERRRYRLHQRPRQLRPKASYRNGDNGDDLHDNPRKSQPNNLLVPLCECRVGELSKVKVGWTFCSAVIDGGEVANGSQSDSPGKSWRVGYYPNTGPEGRIAGCPNRSLNCDGGRTVDFMRDPNASSPTPNPPLPRWTVPRLCSQGRHYFSCHPFACRFDRSRVVRMARNGHKKLSTWQ